MRILLALIVATVMGCTPASTPPASYNTPTAPYPPQLIVEHEGVKVWKVRESDYGSTIYFTTPTGDVFWTTQERQGKGTVTKQHQTLGTAR